MMGLSTMSMSAILKCSLKHTSAHYLPTETYKPSETMWLKEKMLATTAFYPFPTMFLPISKQMPVFELHLFCPLHVLSFWTSLKFCCLV